MRALWVCSRERTRRIALYKRSSIPKQNLKTLLIFLHDDTVIQLFAWCSIKTMPQITQSQVVRVTTRQWTVPLSAGVVWREEGRWHGDGTQKPQTSDPSQEGGDSIGWHLRLFQTPPAVGCWAEAAPQRLESQFVGVFTFNGNDCQAESLLSMEMIAKPREAICVKWQSSMPESAHQWSMRLTSFRILKKWKK